jgi:hypothetical protein
VDVRRLTRPASKPRPQKEARSDLFPRRVYGGFRFSRGTKRDYLRDPTGLKFPHANPLDETKTDPPDPSDMKYQRWYPTAVALPDGRVLKVPGPSSRMRRPRSRTPPVPLDPVQVGVPSVARLVHLNLDEDSHPAGAVRGAPQREGAGKDLRPRGRGCLRE